MNQGKLAPGVHIESCNDVECSILKETITEAYCFTLGDLTELEQVQLLLGLENNEGHVNLKFS